MRNQKKVRERPTNEMKYKRKTQKDSSRNIILDKLLTHPTHRIVDINEEDVNLAFDASTLLAMSLKLKFNQKTVRFKRSRCRRINCEPFAVEILVYFLSR